MNSIGTPARDSAALFDAYEEAPDGDREAIVQRALDLADTQDPDALDLLVDFPDSRVQTKAIRNPHTRWATLQLIWDLADSRTRGMLLSHPEIPESDLRDYADDPVYMAAIAANPNVPVDVLMTIWSRCQSGETSSVWVARTVLASPVFPMDQLPPVDDLVASPMLFHGLLDNPNAPEIVIRTVAARLTDVDEAYRRTVATNLARSPHTPVEIRAELARHMDVPGRAEFAADLSTPAWVRVWMVLDKSPTVRKAAVLTDEEAVTVATDPDGHHATRDKAIEVLLVRERSDLVTALLSHPDPKVRRSVNRLITNALT